MIKELPPAKHASEWTAQEREQIMLDAADAAVLFAGHLKRLAEIEKELRERDTGHA